MSPTVRLLVQIMVVISAARGLGAAVRRLGQPGVVGEMLAGVLLGPSLLGRIAPALTGLVFPARSLEALNAFSLLGLVLYMLLVGTRIDVADIRRRGRLVLLTGVASVLIPFALGAAVALVISSQVGIAPAAKLPFALFVALSVSVTAFPVLVRIVGEHGLEATRLGTTAIAAASLGDLVVWAVLPFLSSLRGSAHQALVTTSLLLAGYGVLMVGVLGPLLRWLLRRLRLKDARFTLIVLAALASAAATEWIGIHPLVGSFFVGVLISGDRQLGSLLTTRTEPLTITLFLPLFFALMGLRTNLNALPAQRLLIETAAIVIVAVVGKIVAPMIIGRANKLSWREAVGLGALMNTRGLVELVVIGIGADVGLLPPAVVTILTLMAIVTTAMRSPILTCLGFSNRKTSEPGAQQPEADPASQTSCGRPAGLKVW
jgi:Kef-type K+ transport system membrane component KefB